MPSAKDIRVEPIAAADARRIVRAIHYSGKVVNNSTLHLGVFLNGKCGGAMQFGNPMDRRKLIGLVRGTKWNEFIELNRMAFADWLPRNSESRAMAVAFRMIRKTYPWMKWVVSFANAAQCGDGAIYRACGFVLTGIKQTEFVRLASGEVLHRIALHNNHSFVASMGGKYATPKAMAAKLGGSVIRGAQLRYLYFLDPTCAELLTVPRIPFSAIDELGVGMYRGQKTSGAGSIDVDAPGYQPGQGGSTPTPALHTDGD